MEVGHNYRQVAKWLTRERIPAQRAGQWKAQSVKNLVVRYWRLTGRRLPDPLQEIPDASAPAETRLKRAFRDLMPGVRRCATAAFMNRMLKERLGAEEQETPCV
jgi:hypothetical protein